MSSIDDAIEAMFETFPEWTESHLGVAARKGIEAAVESGHLIPADQLEQVTYCHVRPGDDCEIVSFPFPHDRCPDCVPVYRKREPR